jgi:hypothetical protein
MGDEGTWFQKPNLDGSICFFTLVKSVQGKRHTQFLLKSLRTWGGPLADSPFLVFQFRTEEAVEFDFGLENVHVIPVELDRGLEYWFGDKVVVCSMAEKMMGGYVHSLVWLSAQCLILHPPFLFDLDRSYEAAFRPVHIKNIGLKMDEPLHPFWRAIYDRVGIDDLSHSVRSFVDGHEIRPYFNTHIFSVDPSVGILQTWLEHFRGMTSDEVFQSESCRDQEHQIFLHQAVLSALVGKMLDWERVRILSEEYSYPLHLHREVPLHLQPASLNQLVCPVYEGVYQHPNTLNGLEIHEPLETWILDNMPTQEGS